MKKIAIGVLALIVLLGAAFLYLNNRNRTMSPPGEATLTSGGLSINITYSRPSVRGRLIFGPESQNALQPYGKYWRLGANESTEVTFSRDVLFNGSAVKAGTYRMYAVPGEQNFEIVLNTELGKWGAFEPNYSLDILKTQVAVQKTSSSVEQFTTSLAPSGDGIDIIFEWSNFRFVVPVKAQ